jgi:hypothetical protein
VFYMGINFYLNMGDIGEDLPTHIGRSAAGWTFALHVYPELGVADLEDWIGLINKYPDSITDQHGKRVTAMEMLTQIQMRETDVDFTKPMSSAAKAAHGVASWLQFHQENQSCAGPNGLLRNTISGSCIGHGEGTWDLIVGDFS